MRPKTPPKQAQQNRAPLKKTGTKRAPRKRIPPHNNKPIEKVSSSTDVYEANEEVLRVVDALLESLTGLRKDKQLEEQLALVMYQP